ncbi:unnamed protein product [Darwinula stevensoni]|uniref:C-type lectin domain-containing protein n=1 Tax=Darwinula stevensoni TaxID=69355 RepID=A0A7R9A6P9_9CRUS|nr:unnamed protein product [Darwinula stevensoni]CAG0889938.1 unnamed protein product [Darwinula stevensoni]
MSNTNWTWHDGTEASYSHWGTGEPNGHGGGEICAEMVTTGFWNDVNCEEPPRGYLCEVLLTRGINENGEKGGMSGAAIFGIVIATFIAVGIAVFLLHAALFRPKRMLAIKRKLGFAKASNNDERYYLNL